MLGWITSIRPIRLPPDGPYLPIFYQRLLLPGRFPDGTFALISVVDRHHDVEIIGLDSDNSPRMSDDVVMNDVTIESKFDYK